MHVWGCAVRDHGRVLQGYPLPLPKLPQAQWRVGGDSGGIQGDQVEFSGDERKIYESSPGVGRAFCGKCGTPLTWEGDGGDRGPIIEFHISTFDNPNVLVPTAHAFHPERISWFDIADNLPRYAGFTGRSPLLRHGPVSDGLPLD